MAEHGEFLEQFPDEHPNSYDHSEPKGSLLFVFFGISVVLIITVALGVQYYYDQVREKEIYERVLAPENTQLLGLRAQEEKDLYTFGYADKNAGRVRLTIDRAMDLVATEASENRSKYPTASYRVKTPEELAAGTPVSQPGAAAVNNATNQGVGSNQNVRDQANKPGQ